MLTQAWRNAKDFLQEKGPSEAQIESTKTYRLADHTPNTWTMLNVDVAFKDQAQTSGLGVGVKN